VSRDVIFEGRSFKRSLESRDNIEEVSETQIDVSWEHRLRCQVHQFQG